MPARRAAPFLARSVAICTCRVSANMSGASRVLSRTDGSIFLAAAKASALSRMADNALRPISKAGRDARDIENDMRRLLFFHLNVGWAKVQSTGTLFQPADHSSVPTTLKIAVQWWARRCGFRVERWC